MQFKPKIFQQVVGSTTPPGIAHSFPFDGFLGVASDMTEINAYVSDNTEVISSVVYYDSNYPNGLAMHRAINVTSKYGMWIPDITGDGAVGSKDINYLQMLMNENRYDPQADLNNDGKINYKDYFIISSVGFIFTFVANYDTFLLPVYEKKPISFVISVADGVGNSYALSGTFTITNSVTKIAGKWYINDIEVSTNIALETNDVMLMFVSDVDFNGTVQAVVGGKTYTLVKTAPKVWVKQVKIAGLCDILFSAKSADETAYATQTITVNAPEALQINFLSMALMAIGFILLANGIYTEKKEREIY